MGGGTVASVLSILRQRRWIGFTLLTVFFVALFLRLSIWQLSRRAQRQAANRVITRQLDAKPLDYAALAGNLDSVPDYAAGHQWRAVSVTGTWDGAHQFLWRNQPFGNDWGYDVITPLLPAGGGAALLVDRGWINGGQTSAGPGSVPAPRSGTVTVNGWLQPPVGGRSTSGLPTRQVLAVDPAQMDRELPYAVLSAYAQLAHESPGSPHAPSPQPSPTLGNGPHLAYAIEWVLFAFIAIGGWWVYVRRAAEDAALASAAESDHPRQPPGAPAKPTVRPDRELLPAGPAPPGRRPADEKEIKLPPSIQQIG
jgi:cytochrome oxidase assembly protein ShyY1